MKCFISFNYYYLQFNLLTKTSHFLFFSRHWTIDIIII